MNFAAGGRAEDSVDALLEGIGEGFFALDQAWRFTAFNRAAEEIFGLSRLEVLGRDLWQVSPRIVGTEFELRYRRVMSERTRQAFESHSALQPDRFHEVRAFPFGDGVGVAFRDITDRKRAEQSAQESERRLRALADALPLLISFVDQDEVFRFANKPYEQWFARPLSEILGHRMADVMDPEIYALRRPFFERAFAGETVTFEADFPRFDASVRTEVTHVPFRDEAGQIGGFYSVVQDVTARKLAEKELYESEERFRSIANSAPVPIWVSRLDGSREFVNGAYREFLGVSLPDALRFDWRGALHEDDRARILREQAQGEGSGEPFVLEARYRRGDGHWRWLRSESRPRWDVKGNQIGFIGVAHDVTSSKEAEQKLTEINEILERRIQERSQQLAATEALIHTFFNHSSECHAVLVEDERGRFRYEEANPATLRLYGKPRAEVIGRTIEDVFGAEIAAEVEGHLAVCLRKGAPYKYERAQGDFVLEAVATPAPRDGAASRRVIVSAHDVTERRRLEQQLRQSQKMEAVGQLTGGVAHDFNNLLTLILGGLDIIGRGLPNLPAPSALTRIERGREMALDGVRRSVSLTSRLLAFSRQQPLAPRSLDANHLVVGLCELLSRTLGESIVLETTLAHDLWSTFADAHQLESALLNLALNARDAMPEGGRLTIETANASLDEAYVASLNEPVAAGQYVMIAVADNGVGMDRKTRDRAFDPFFTTKGVGKGTGLGLSQVYGFVRQSAGHVNIHSELGEGAIVRIYLPRHLAAADETTPRKAPDYRGLMGAETILLVEDDEALRDYATEILKELGYSVLQARDAAPALDKLKTHPEIGLLLTDMVMPGGINGRQLADRALSMKPELKVLFMTGYTRGAIVQQDEIDIGRQVISKPFSFAELALKVREQFDAPIDLAK